MEQMQTLSDAIGKEAACLLQHTELVQRVPLAVRNEIDSVLSRKPSDRPQIDELWRNLDLAKRFGVTRRMMRSYVHQRQATPGRFSQAQVAKTLAALLDVPIEQSEDLQNRAHVMLLAKLVQALDTKDDLSPEYLLKMADALSRQRSALTKAQAQALAKHKLERAARSAVKRRKNCADSEVEFHERIRRIYGIDFPRGLRRQPPAAPTTPPPQPQPAVHSPAQGP